MKVLGVRSGQVKIGIEAPRELAVHRQEIFERIKAENGHAGDEQSETGCPPPALQGLSGGQQTADE